MSDKKTQPDTGPTNPDETAHTAWSMPFQEMMEKMMADCDCRLEDMASLWGACCGTSREKKKGHEI
ncbi:hypothetical protein ANRL3_02717 [Anaerolineae bacterium]|nr:hypothetical protein ANRL3_02717 [Anaerolineae bacterium]